MSNPISTNGFMVRAGAGDAEARTLQGLGGMVITNPDGAAGDPTIELRPNGVGPNSAQAFAMWGMYQFYMQQWLIFQQVS